MLEAPGTCGARPPGIAVVAPDAVAVGSRHLEFEPAPGLFGFLKIVGGLGPVNFSWRVAPASGQSPPLQARRTTMLRLGTAAPSITILLGVG